MEDVEFSIPVVWRELQLAVRSAGGEVQPVRLRFKLPAPQAGGGRPQAPALSRSVLGRQVMHDAAIALASIGRPMGDPVVTRHFVSLELQPWASSL